MKQIQYENEEEEGSGHIKKRGGTVHDCTYFFHIKTPIGVNLNNPEYYEAASSYSFSYVLNDDKDQIFPLHC